MKHKGKKVNMKKTKISFITVMITLLLTVSAVFAWRDLSQMARNVFHTGNPEYSVMLEKQDSESKQVLPGAVFELYRANGKKIGDTLITNANGVIEVDGLLAGDYYFKEIKAPNGYQIQDMNNKYEFTIVEQESENKQPVKVVVENIKNTYPLQIEKKVMNEDGTTLKTWQLDKEFTFTITLGDIGTEHKYSINGGEEQIFISGNTLMLQHDDVLTFPDVPYNTYYTIIESPEAGFMVTTDTSTTGTLPIGGQEIVFANEYGKGKEEVGQGSLVIEKIVENDDRSALEQERIDDIFTFTVIFNPSNNETTYAWEVDGEVQTPIKSGERITLQHDQKAEFKDIPAGTIYTVIETPMAGYIQETMVQTGTIYKDTISESIFKNIFEKEKYEIGNITISKEVVGEDKAFNFILHIGDEVDTTVYRMSIDGVEGTFTNGDMISLSNQQSITIYDIPVGTPYEVTELFDRQYMQNKTYQSGQVTNNHDRIQFINTEKPEITEEGKIIVKKQVVGEHIDTDKEFAFTLYVNGKVKDTFTLKDGEEKEFKLSVKDVYFVVEEDYSKDNYSTQVDIEGANANGNVSKDTQTITFINTVNGSSTYETITLEGTKHWELGNDETRETPEYILIHVYDGELCVVDRLVTANDNWQWKIELPKYREDGVTEIKYHLEETPVDGYLTEITEFDITNTFDERFATHSIPVEKKVTGTTTSSEPFTFILQAETENAPMPEGSVDTQKSKTITGAGMVDFGEMKFVQEGSYVYTITETKGTSVNYQYDSTEYRVTITTTIKDGIMEKMVHYETLIESVWQEMKDITMDTPLVFTNHYSDAWQDVAYYAPVIEKQITGNAPAPEEVFNFVLTPKEASYPMPENTTVSITNTGTIQYSPIAFISEGTYVYEIQEQVGQTQGFTYDETIYTLTIQVTKDSDGYLHTKAEYHNGSQSNDSSAIFINQYNYVPTGETTIIKGSKQWEHGNNPVNSRPKSITVVVKRDDTVVIQKEITEESHWRWEFEVDKYDSEGNSIDYTIDELPVKNYQSEIKDYNITNTYMEYEDTITTIQGEKIWNHQNNSKKKYPNHVMIYVKNKEEIVSTQVVTSQDQWKYTFVLPKYDEEGKEIKYTIDEKKVDGYGKYISGYNIINTYGYADGQTPPKTGDDIMDGIWISLTLLSGVGVFLGMRKVYYKRRKQ